MRDISILTLVVVVVAVTTARTIPFYSASRRVEDRSFVRNDDQHRCFALFMNAHCRRVCVRVIQRAFESLDKQGGVDAVAASRMTIPFLSLAQIEIEGHE